MRILYADCSMGAAGDMLTAALLELFDDKEKIVNELNSLGIPGVTYEASPETKCGIVGTHMTVKINGEVEGEHHHHHHDHDHEQEHGHHHHSSMHDIEHIVKGHLKIEPSVADEVMKVYGLIAEAESHAHGRPVTEIHFHEVGTMDAVADVTAVCYLLSKLNIDKVVVSPIHVGSGTVKCAHGTLPVPAPATAFILKGVPTYGGQIKSELCTPTGAALLKTFASEFGPQPVMSVEKIGYGMGKKDFEAANCVRLMLGESEDKTDSVTILECNIDDMTGEELGFAFDRLFAAGALDVFSIPVGMKKNRQGYLLSVICNDKTKDEIVRAIFKHTSTIGIRESVSNRYVLDRRIEEIDTKYGTVRKKISSGYGVSREKFEYNDIAAIASAENRSVKEITKELGGN